MRLSVLIDLPSAREQGGRRPAVSLIKVSLIKEYRARLRVSRTSTSWLVRSVALSVRFIDKVAQSATVFAPSVRGAGGHGANASVAGRLQWRKVFGAPWTYRPIAVTERRTPKMTASACNAGLLAQDKDQRSEY